MAEKPYDPDVSEPAWPALVAAWPWIRKDDWLWFKRGKCPNCDHETVLELSVAVGVAPAADGFTTGGIPDAKLPDTVDFRCLCDHEHAEEKTGCGLLIEGIPGPVGQ